MMNRYLCNFELLGMVKLNCSGNYELMLRGDEVERGDLFGAFFWYERSGLKVRYLCLPWGKPLLCTPGKVVC